MRAHTRTHIHLHTLHDMKYVHACIHTYIYIYITLICHLRITKASLLVRHGLKELGSPNELFLSWAARLEAGVGKERLGCFLPSRLSVGFRLLRRHG